MSQNSVRQQMVELLADLAPDEGYNLSALADVRFLRSNRPLRRAPVLYDPGIVIVCQGRKRGFLGSEVYTYDAQQVLAVAVPVPFSMQTDASAKEPLLAIYLRLDFSVATELLLQLEEAGSLPSAPARSLTSTPMDARLQSTVLRFLQAMSSPLDAAILGRSLVREIYFRVLTSEQGASMRAALTAHGQFGKVAKAIRKIHGEFDRPLDIAQLAHAAGMSAASLHAHFKAVTDTSPMQYLKSTRLHQARLLMARDHMTAQAASGQVGYESASQFSREFKRMFGRSPGAETRRMQQAFALPPPAPGAAYVASH
jgi:AraC-like DNA-binding protein